MSTTSNREAIEKLSRDPFARAVRRDEGGNITGEIDGTIEDGLFLPIGNKEGVDLGGTQYVLERHPAASWIDASSGTIERDCVGMEIYCTPSALANLSRTIGYCAGLNTMKSTQLKRYSAWILIGLYRNLDYLGCWRNRLHYDDEGRDLHVEYPYDFDATEDEKQERYDKIEEETVAKVPSSKKILYADNQFSFGWTMYHALPHATYKSALAKFRDEYRDLEDWQIENKLAEELKICQDEDAKALLGWRTLTETHYHYYFTTRYRRGMNGGLIQRFLQDDLEKMKSCEKYHSYSVHS